MSTWTIKEVLDWAAEDFKSKGMATPRLEAEVLLAHILKYSRLDLYTKFDQPLDETERSRFRDAISKRRTGIPVAHITGIREFWSLDFEVNEHVLIPRPETELLVETIIEAAPKDASILDLCTGSGCIAIALATELPGVTVDATDVSKQACEVARRNAKRHNVEERVTVHEGDLFAPLPQGNEYSVIVSNPPYVMSDEIATLQTEVQQEPRLALDGGKDGLDIVRTIIAEAEHHMTDGGLLLLEVDPRQTKTLATDLGKAHLGANGAVLTDLAGQKRAVLFRR